MNLIPVPPAGARLSQENNSRARGVGKMKGEFASYRVSYWRGRVECSYGLAVITPASPGGPEGESAGQPHQRDVWFRNHRHHILAQHAEFQHIAILLEH